MQLLHLVGKATAVCWLHLFLKSSSLHPLATITFASIQWTRSFTDTSYWTGEAICYCTYIPSIGVLQDITAGGKVTGEGLLVSSLQTHCTYLVLFKYGVSSLSHEVEQLASYVYMKRLLHPSHKCNIPSYSLNGESLHHHSWWMPVLYLSSHTLSASVIQHLSANAHSSLQA